MLLRGDFCANVSQLTGLARFWQMMWQKLKFKFKKYKHYEH